MKAVMYGGGNIGRGFIGYLFSASGYETAIVDVVDAVIETLNQNKEYPVRIIKGDEKKDLTVKNVSAVDGKIPEAVADAIAEADIMATAVGVNVLKFIIPNIVLGLKKRKEMGKGPFNIIICENLMDANKVIEKMIKEHLNEEEKAWFDENIGLVEASIGRMVPVQTDEMKDGDPLRVCVEEYGFLPVDKDAFKGPIPEICGMVPSSPFDFYLKRKLYVHNMGHATCAYLGGLLGLDYIYQAIDKDEIYLIVRGAMEASARALAKRYDMSLENLLLHVTDLLNRFTNAALKDTCARVGGDPARKLKKDDRLIGSALTCMEAGISPAYIAIGAAAGLCRYLNEVEGVENCLSDAKKTLKEHSELEEENPLTDLILEFYQLLQDGASFAALRRIADEKVAASLSGVI